MSGTTIKPRIVDATGRAIHIDPLSNHVYVRCGEVDLSEPGLYEPFRQLNRSSLTGTAAFQGLLDHAFQARTRLDELEMAAAANLDLVRRVIQAQSAATENGGLTIRALREDHEALLVSADALVNLTASGAGQMVAVEELASIRTELDWQKDDQQSQRQLRLTLAANRPPSSPFTPGGPGAA